MARLRLYALTTVGGLIILCELFAEAMSPHGPSFDNLVWILSLSLCTPSAHG